ncbi:MFS general substrate transporter [Polychaeton citri CBS 116435]|uniref:MFS general substrate transporter n=1 Tax=Polychaeton citri CBS 116435 TaxID=1314669 RepID=A0A9P4UVF9_9PEZI|nr:MFS general substrate transporter [Polychaeton citri CBS 116435]
MAVSDQHEQRDESDGANRGHRIELEKKGCHSRVNSSHSLPSVIREDGDTDDEENDDGDEQHDGHSHRIVSFSHNDPTNPYNYSMARKLYIVITCMILVLNSTIGSALPSGSAEVTIEYFGLDASAHSSQLVVLPISIYLVGYVMGPLLFPPITESYGRKKVMLATFLTFTAFTLGCALAPDFASLIVFRFLVGISASTPISVIGGIYADIYNQPKSRGRAMAIFMAATTFGPLLGPIASGFTSPVSWRWTYWIGLILAGVTWPLLALLPETYGPVILKDKARRLRKERGDSRIVAPLELERRDLRQLVVVTLTRPVRMFLFEAIVLSSCLYLALAYGIFYMYFQAYPIIYKGIYGFNSGEEGLAFLPIGVGSLLACGVYLWWDHYLDTVRARDPPPKWSQKEEYRRLPLACLGAPLFVVALFWLGWTARGDVHWIVPVLSALPFGVGFLLLFMSLINYIVDAYEIYAASAMGAASASRSMMGVVLPFAAKPMYDRLGVAWACSLLGFLSLAMGLVPFVFIRYGGSIRAHSAFCQELMAKKEKDQARQRRTEERRVQRGLDVSDSEKQVP